MSDEKIFRGKIVGLEGSWGSGIATLVVKDSVTGEIKRLSCENAPTIRALDSAYGEVIGRGHTALVDRIKGKEIYYFKGDWVGLGGFTPVEMASPELEFEYFQSLSPLEYKKFQDAKSKRKVKKVL